MFKRNLLIATYNTLKYFNRFKITKDANIITFHSVNPNILKSSVIYIQPADFDDLMKILSTSYNVISLTTLIDIINQKKELDPNTIVITFDDGYLDNYEYAVPILNKYNLPACFFITSGFMNTDKSHPWNSAYNSVIKNMTWSQLREIKEMGFEIGAHTVNHVNLNEIELQTAKKEVESSKKQIEDKLGIKIPFFAYPFGGKNNINNDVKEFIQEIGFECCCSAYGGKVNKCSDVFNLERISNYPTNIETQMELDGFMTYRNGQMKLSL